MNSLKKKLAGRLEEYLSVVTQIFAGSATFCPPPCIRVAKMRRAPRKDVDKVFGWFQKQIWPFIIDGLAFFATLFCRTTHTATHLISEDVSANTTGIDIEFFQRVQVSTTDFVETSLSAFLAEVICSTRDLISYLCKYLLEMFIKIIFKVGGLMGLWLGLGVVQALQVLANTISPLFGIFKEGKSTLA